MATSKRILLTGGAGYLGAIAAHHLRAAGYDIHIVDDFSTGHREACRDIPFTEASITDEAAMRRLFESYRPEAVVHLAALSNIEVCRDNPEKAKRINVEATGLLLALMKDYGVKPLVFASSAAVYAPIAEDEPLAEPRALEGSSVYGQSKIEAERMVLSSGLQPAALRFFNLAGADETHGLFECHHPETHLIPKVIHAIRHGQEIDIYGSDYPTKDGTAIRDYVHVLDASSAIAAALAHMIEGKPGGAFNVASGMGHSVMQVVETIAAQLNIAPKLRMLPRRANDVAYLYANIRKIRDAFGWQPVYPLAQIIKSAGNRYAKRTTCSPY